MTDEAKVTTVDLTNPEMRTVRMGLDLLIEKYDKIAKDAEKVGDLHINAAAIAETQRITGLKLRFSEPAEPTPQIDAFEAGEPDDRPLHLRLADHGYGVTAAEIEEAWNDLDRENVTDWLERRRTANPNATPPALLMTYRALN